MEYKELNAIIQSHELWLKGYKNGKRADLHGTKLHGADLYYTNLRDADLRYADLYGVNLRRANLYGANLHGVNLHCADLYGADLRRANLYGANLCGTNLHNADLFEADLREVKNAPFLPQTIVCPEEGSFIGFKKVDNRYIVKLEIPVEAKRSSATSRKCRCEFAKVLSITNLDGTDDGFNEVINTDYIPIVYKVGEMVYPDSFDEDRWNECSHGIHFFITRQEAVEY